MIKTSTRAQKRRVEAKRRRARVPAKLNATHPLGNRATRQSQAAFDRKDSRSKKPSTTIVMKLVDKKPTKMRVNTPAIQTKGAFGKKIGSTH